jgi:hypothetical protein
MPELELIRTRDDRRLYALPGVGNLRLGGWLSAKVEASTGGDTYTFQKRGILGRVFTATDARTGAQVAEFRPRSIRRGGTITWQATEWDLRPAALLSERYALARPGQDRELATVEGRGWGKRPVTVTTDDATAIDPGLLLFVVFAVRVLAEDMSTAASSGASTAAIGG